MRDPNKLATFPLDAYKEAPDDQVIFGTGAWSLTVGDVRAAAAQTGNLDDKMRADLEMIREQVWDSYSGPHTKAVVDEAIVRVEFALLHSTSGRT